MHAPGIWGILIVGVVVVLLFGRGKIAGMMGEVASGIKSFQKGLREEPADKQTAQIDASAQVDAPRETEKKDV